MADSIQRVQATPAPAHLMPAALRPMPMAQAALTPKEIWGIIRRHLLMIILFTVFGFIAAGVAYVIMLRYYPSYTAQTGINVLPPIVEPPFEIRGTQTNRDLYYQFRLTKATLMKQQGMLEKLLGRDAVRKTNWFKQFAKIGPDGEIMDVDFTKALKKLESDLRASAPRDQDFLIVSMTCGNPEEAQTIVNEMVRIFLADQQTIAQSSISEELTSARGQLAAVQGELQQIQGRLESLRGGTEFARLNIEGANFRDYMDEQLGRLEIDYSNLESQKSSLETTIEILKRRAFNQDYDQVVQETLEQDPVVRQLRLTINSTESFLAQQLARFGQNHRRVNETRHALEQLKSELDRRKIEIAEIQRKSIYQQAEDEMAALNQQLEATTLQVQEARRRYKAVDDLRAQYEKDEILRQEQQAMLEKINEHVENLTAQYNDPKLSKLQSLGTAPRPRSISSPNWKIYFPAGFMLGLLAGVGLAFAVEIMNDLVRTPSDVMRHLRAPLLGAICHVNDDDDVEQVELGHAVRQAPYSIMSECYRQLRTNLKMAPGGQDRRILLVTSPDAGDGKTTVAANLASTLLAENKKVLLIDANFRRPATAHLFPRTAATGALIEHSDFGLSNYLMGQCPDESKVIRSSGIANLDIIDSGPLPANPSELLDSTRMMHLLDQCRQHYDRVIIDGPPMLISDAKILASKADGTLLVLNASSTHRGAAVRILRELRGIQDDSVGVVLMGIKSHKGGYFQEVYRGYLEYQRVHVSPVS